MDILISILTGISLAMDCLAVSVSIGSTSKVIKREYLRVPLHFGLFQFFMAVIGYFLGSAFHGFLESVDHWIAFVLLAAIGLKMVTESMKKDKEKIAVVSEKQLIALSVATSIDSMTMGVVLNMLRETIWFPATIIGLMSFIFSYFGIVFGKKLGEENAEHAELLGGLILIGLGLKTLSHTK